MADLFSDVTPPTKINADASVRKWGSVSPEEDAAFAAVDNSPNARLNNISEIDSELARKDLTAANRKMLLDIKAGFSGKATTTPSLFDDVSPPTSGATGDIFSGIVPPAKPMADISNWDYLKNKLSGDWEDIKNLPSKISSGAQHLFTPEGAKEQVSGLAKMGDLAMSVPSMALAYGLPIPKLIAEGMGPGRQYALDNYKEEKDRLLQQTNIDQTLQKLGVAKELNNPLVSGIGHLFGDPSQALANAVSKEGTLSNDVVRDLTMFGMPLVGAMGANRIARRSENIPREIPSPRGVEKLPVQTSLFDDVLPEYKAQEGPYKEGAGLMKGPSHPIPEKLNNAIAQARFELDKPEWKKAQEAFSSMQDELATPKILQKTQEGFDFGPEVNPATEPNAEVKLNPRQGDVLSKDIIAGNGNEYTLNYHTADGTIEVKDAHGNTVGSAATSNPLHTPAKVGLVDVQPYHQRAGISSAIHDMYEEVHKGGLDKSDITTPNGKAFWEARNAGKTGQYQELSPTRILTPEEAQVTPNTSGKTGMEPIGDTAHAQEGSMADFEALQRGETPTESLPYTKQLQLHINPLDALISEAKKSAEPKPEKIAKPLPEPEISKGPIKGEQASFAEQEPSFKEGVDQTNALLDTADKDIYPEGTPSKEEFEKKSSLPIVMSPDKLLTKFDINADTVRGLGDLHDGLSSPIHKRRDFWVENPVLVGALDSITELVNRGRRNILNALGTHTVDSFFKERNKLTDAETIQAARIKSRADETSNAAMNETGRINHTYEEYRTLGASDKVAKALVEGNKAYELGHATNNETGRLQGHPELPIIPNYMPHQHAYPFRVTITNLKSGEKQVRSFPTREEARRAAEDIHRNIGKDSAVDYTRVDPTSSSYADAMDALRDQRNKFKGEELSGFSKVIDSIISKRDAAFLGATKERTGKGGYTGSHGFPETTDPLALKHQLQDAKFVMDLPEKYLNDAIRYSTDAKTKSYMDALRQAGVEHGVAHTGAWQQILDTLDKHVKSYTDPVFDTSKRSIADKALDLATAWTDKGVIPGHVKVPALEPQALTSMIRAFGKISLASKISPYANMALLPIQYLQFVLSPISTIGGSLRLIAKNKADITSLTKSAMAMGKTPIDVATASVKAFRDTILHQAGENFGTKTYQDAQRAIEWAYKEGHLGSFMEHEHLTVGNRMMRTAAGQAISEHAEYTPRTLAFLSQYNTAKQLGFPEGAARRAAAHGANEIMGDYSKQSKPAFLRSQSPTTGTTISALSTFLLNTTSQLHTLVTNTGVREGTGLAGVKNGKFMLGVVLPLVSYMGIQLATGGWKGLPGFQDYDNLVHYLNGAFDMDLPTSYALKIRSHDALGEHANEAYYGLANEKSGQYLTKSSNIGSLLSYGNFIPSMASDIGKSVYQEGKNITHKMGLTEAPKDKDLYESRKSTTPPNLQFLVENAYAKDVGKDRKILKEGIERDTSGVSRWINPYDPLSERKQRDEKSHEAYTEALQIKQTKNQIDLIKDKADRGEDFSSNVSRLVELNPDVSKNLPALKDMILSDQEKRNMNFTEQKIFDAIKSKSLNKYQNAAHADMVRRLSNR